MMLITKAIRKALPPTGKYAEESDLSKIPVPLKLFTPWSYWTWYITEADFDDDGDAYMYGFVVGMAKESGYVQLKELTDIRGPAGLKIERDRGWEGTLADAYKIENFMQPEQQPIHESVLVTNYD